MLPLKGIRVIAVEQYGAGPIGTLHLASLGADIIKIEDPGTGGDVSRSVGPHFVPDVDPSVASLFFQGLNHNKKSVTLDLSRAEGREILHKMVARADALTSNVRGDVVSHLGLSYEQLSQHNPRLVCGHLTGFGREGSRACWPGYDYMMQAEAGYFSLTGEPDGPPARFGLSIVDFMTGLALAYALTAGLLEARRTGVGRDVDVSLFDVALYNLNYVATWYLNAGASPSRPVNSIKRAMVSYTSCVRRRSSGTRCAMKLAARSSSSILVSKLFAIATNTGRS
jgi:succinate---hydroxymethylglutarate CoA-transferase